MEGEIAANGAGAPAVGITSEVGRWTSEAAWTLGR